MLPGLRFLFVAVVLSLSMLIFGLGAVSLLRTAHQEFANLPTRRAQPDTVFAQQVEANRPMLAILRVDTPAKPVDPPVAERNSADRPTDPDAPNAAPPPGQPSPVKTAEPDRVAAEPDGVPAESDKQAALTTASPAPEKSESADQPASADKSAETPAPDEAAARTEMPAPPAASQAPEARKPEIQPAAIPEPTSAVTVGTTTAASQPASAPTAAAPTSDSANAASSKIATLGGPAVITEPQTAAKTVVPLPAKRAQARQVIKRRRIVRARVAPPPQQPAPFGLFGTQPGT
jgi:hypothetical protein